MDLLWHRYHPFLPPCRYTMQTIRNIESLQTIKLKISIWKIWLMIICLKNGPHVDYRSMAFSILYFFSFFFFVSLIIICNLPIQSIKSCQSSVHTTCLPYFPFFKTFSWTVIWQMCLGIIHFIQLCSPFESHLCECNLHDIWNLEI